MATKNEAKIKFTAETKDFTEQIKRANQTMAELRSEMKLSESQFKGNESSVEALANKKRILQEQLAASADKVEALRQKLEKAKAIYGENSDEVSRLKTQLNNAERQYVDTENAIDDVNNELNRQEKETEETTNSTEELDKALDKTSDGFTVMKGVIADLVSKGLNLLVDGLKDVSKYVIQTGMEFEASMSEVAAISGASGEEVVQLTEKAKQMGASTKFSASESAEAFKYMAMAGWKTGDMLDGISGIMNLAASANTDLGTASDIVTDALTAMGYAAKDAGRLADVMAAAASNANTNVELMGGTFKYAAPVAGALGYSMEDLAVATGLMANAGIKGEIAGTALRAGLTNLVKPSKQASDAMEKYGINIKNADGTVKPLNDTMDLLRKRLGVLPEAEQAAAAGAIFGKEAMSGWLSVINASDDDFAKLTQAINNSEGAANSMATEMQDNLQGDLTLLKSALESVGISAYDGFSTPMRSAVQSITETMSSYDVAKLINGISFEIGELAGKIAEKIPSAMQTLVKGLSWVVENIDAIILGVKTFITTWAIVKGLSIAISIGGVIAKIASLISGLTAGTITIGGMTAAMGGLSAAVAAATAGISLIVTGIVLLVKWIRDSINAGNEFSASALNSANALTEFQWGLDNLQPALSGTKDLLSSAGNSMETLRTKVTNAETAITQIMFDENGKKKQLRAEDIQSIKDYQDEILRLKQEQLEIMRQQQEVELIQLQRKLEKEGSLSQEAAAQAIVDAKASYQASEQAREEAYNAEYNRTVAYYKSRGELESAEAKQALDNLDAWNSAEQQKNASSRDEMIRIAVDESQKWVSADAEKWNNLANNADVGKKEYKKTMNSMNLENAKAFMQMVSTAKTEGVELTSETKTIASNILTTFENLPPSMKESGKDILIGLTGGMQGQFKSLENTTDKTAGEIVNGLKQELGITANSTSGGGGSTVAKGIGRNVAVGLENGMASEKRNLETAATNTASTVVDKLESELQVNSPSRVTKTIGGYVAEGLAVGMEQKKGTLGTRIKTFASGLIGKMKSAFGVASPSKLTAEIGGFLSEGLGVGMEKNADAALSPIRGIVESIKSIDPMSEWDNVSSVGGALNYDVSAQLGDYVANAVEANSPYALLGDLISAVEDLAERAINLDIDGMRFATATAGASDNVSGNRLNLKTRGLAL